MMWTANKDDLRAVKMYVERGSYLDHTEKDGFTAGTLAAGGGHWDVVEYLVRSGANFRIPDATGRTITDYAVEAGRDEIVTLLHRQPTALSQWRIAHRDFALRSGDRRPYNRAYRLMFRMADSNDETEVTWFEALVQLREAREEIVTGPVDFQFAPDGNSLTVTYADGAAEHLQF